MNLHNKGIQGKESYHGSHSSFAFFRIFSLLLLIIRSKKFLLFWIWRLERPYGFLSWLNLIPCKNLTQLFVLNFLPFGLQRRISEWFYGNTDNINSTQLPLLCIRNAVDLQKNVWYEIYSTYFLFGINYSVSTKA